MTIVARLAWRNLWRHRGRTVLTGSGVALGLAFLLVILGLGDGSHRQMIEAAVRMGSGHVLLQMPGYQQRRGLEMTVPEASAAAVVRWARARPEIQGVVPRAFASALLSSASGATGVNLIAVDPGAEAPVSRFPARVTHGRFLEAGDGNAAVVGAGIARLLEVGAGRRVVAMAQGALSGEVRSALLHVVGVLDTGLDEVDQSLVLVPLRLGQDFLELQGGVHQVALVLADQAAADARAREAARVFPDLDVLTWAQADPELAAAIRIDDGGHYLFNGIFFVILGFMVLNTLMMSVLERRREFALLGALGLSPRRRLAVVLAEAAMLAALGSGAGLAIGLGGHTYFRIHGLPLAWFTAERLETAGVMVEPVMYSSLSAARILGSVALVWLLTLGLSVVAARQAARPVDPGLLK